MTSNTLEFFVKMRDLMSGGLAKLAQNSQNTFTKMKGQIANATASTKFMGNSIDELRHKLKQVNEIRFGTVMKSEFNQATRAAKSLESQIARMEGRSRGRSFGAGLMSKAASFIGPIAIAYGLMGFAKSSVKSAMDFQAQSKSYEVFTGNRSVGQQLAMELRQLKQDTIMGPAVYANAQKMLSFGINSSRILPNLKMLGDVSMGDADKLKRLTLAFSEVEAAGQLNGRRLLQFVNAGFNPLQEISRTTGVSMEELSKKMRKGGISAVMLENAFKSATGEGGRFNHMMDQIGETSFGRMKKLEGQWANLKIEAGEVLMPAVSGMMEWASGLLSVFNHTNKVSDSLRTERAEVNGLVSVVTSLNQGNSIRKNLLNELVNKYPDLFGKIDIEKTKNSELLDILNKVNAAYDIRIAHAANNELHDQYRKEIYDNQQTADQAAAILKLFNAGRIEDAIRLKDKYGFSFWDSDFTRGDEVGRTKAILQNMVKDYSKWANTAKQKDLAVSADDNSTTLSEVFAFYGAHKNKLPKGFLEEYNKIFKDLGLSPGSTTTIANSLLGNYDFSKIKSLMGMGANSGGTVTPGTQNAEGDSKVASSIAGGGPRVININGVKFTDKIELHGGTMRESEQELERRLEEMFLRILNSGASVQG